MQLVKSAQRYDGCDLNYPFGANIVTALDFLTLISYFYIPICNQLILHKLFQFMIIWIFYCVYKNGPNSASFCLFLFLSHDKYSTNTVNYKSKDGVLGSQTRGSRIVGVDESTELWRSPFYCIFAMFTKHQMNRLFRWL